VLSIFLLHTDKNILRTYLEALDENLIKEFNYEEFKDYKNAFYELYTYCLDKRNGIELDEINKAIYKSIKNINNKYSNLLRNNEEEQKILIEMLEMILDFSIKTIQSGVDINNRNNLAICYDIIIDIYKNDQISIYEEVMDSSMKIFVKEYETKSIDLDLSFILKLSGIITYEIACDENSREVWKKTAINRFLNVINFIRVESIKTSKFIIILMKELVTNKNSVARSNKDIASKLYDCFFKYSKNYEEEVFTYDLYYYACLHIIEELKREDVEVLIDQFIENFITNIKKLNEDRFEIHLKNKLILKEIQKSFSNYYSVEDIQELLVELLKNHMQFISNDKIIVVYIEYLFESFEEDYEDESFHQTIGIILAHFRIKNINLTQFIFNKYIEMYISNIKDQKSSKLFISTINYFLDKSIASNEMTVFPDYFFILSQKFKSYVENEKKISNEFYEVINIYSLAGKKCIDLNSSQNYSLILDEYVELTELKNIIRSEEYIDYIFSRLFSLAKYSMEKYSVESIKASSNSMAWYIKKNYISRNKRDSIDKIKYLIELFDISIKIDENNLIIPIFIGTAFIMLGSLLCDKNDKVDIRGINLVKHLNNVNHDKKDEILYLSYKLRTDKDNKIYDSEFKEENIREFYKMYKKHSVKK
jgi:hypothetical protein